MKRNFHDYELLTMAQVPDIDIHFIANGGRPGGAGEPGVPALCNAIFAATGQGVCRLPLSAQGYSYRT